MKYFEQDIMSQKYMINGDLNVVYLFQAQNEWERLFTFTHMLYTHMHTEYLHMHKSGFVS